MEDMNKQGLFFWLKSIVESGRCPGVTWVDREEGTFQIPWSNQKSRSWQKEDSSVFLEYAKHTCKYKPGDKMDFPKWKQNLKSAINKNRFIERLRDHDHLSGPKPYRVYRFISEKNTRKNTDDNIPDEYKSWPLNEELHQYHSTMMVPDGAISNELFIPERSTSTSSTCTESESASSPAPSVISVGNLPLSPDLPRNDVYDESHGNIPTFVNTLDLLSCDEENIFPGMLESSLSVTCHIPVANVDSSTVVEVNRSRESAGQLTAHHTIQTVKNGNGHQCSLESLAQSDHSRQSALPESSVASALYTAPHSSTDINSDIFPNAFPNQNLSCPRPIEKSIHRSGIAYNPNLQYPTPAQSGVDSSVNVHIRNLGYPAPRQKVMIRSKVCHTQDAAYPTPVQKSGHILTADHVKSIDYATTVQNSVNSGRTVTPTILQNDLSNTYTNDTNLHLPQARLGTAPAFSNSNTEVKTTVDNLQSVSFSELDMCGGGISDQPSSMDTYEEAMNSGTQQVTSPQFTNDRDFGISVTTQTSIPREVEHVTEDSVMHVEVLYGTPHRTVKKVNITSRRSICRLFFGEVNTAYMQNAIKGQQDSEEVELPSVDELDYNDNTKSKIRRLLNEMEQGIVISYINGDIFVERRCLPRVYLSDGACTSENLTRSTKKRPDVATQAFDHSKFREAIELNKKNGGPVPKDHFFLTIGYEILPNDDSPTRHVPVYVVVRHVQAAKERYNILGASAIAPNPMFSDPNSFDETVRFFKKIDLKKS